MAAMMRSIGSICRGVGQVMDKAGARLQGTTAYVERLPMHARAMAVGNRAPVFAPSIFIAPNASLVGDVSVKELSSVFYAAIVRGDTNRVTIGSMSTVGDSTSITATSGPVTIGDSVFVGARCSLDSCTIEEGAHIGGGSVLMPGVVVGADAVVSPGSVVPANTKIPAKQLWAGSPAVFVRMVGADEHDQLRTAAGGYYWLSRLHAQETGKSLAQSYADEQAYAEERMRDPAYGTTVLNYVEPEALPSLTNFIYPLQLRTYFEVDREMVVPEDAVVWLDNERDPAEVMMEVLDSQGMVDHNPHEQKKSYWFVN